MNKYSDKSDFEINKAVAILTDAVPFPIGTTEFRPSSVSGMESAIIVKSSRKVGTFNPCNNPADAMPIIFENKIDLTYLVGDMVCAKHKEYWCIRKNPYRAGCEVYLLMKDAENEKI